MRTLGIDLGSRRVGLAMSDESGRFATPLEILQVSSAHHAIPAVLAWIKREDVRRVVVGLPLNMDDSLGPAARGAIDWGRELTRLSTIPVVFVDERLSSFSVEQDLIDRKRGGEKITRKQKKERLDAIVAADLLQAYLDGKLEAVEVREII